MTPHN